MAFCMYACNVMYCNGMEWNVMYLCMCVCMYVSVSIVHLTLFNFKFVSQSAGCLSVLGG